MAFGACRQPARHAYVSDENGAWPLTCTCNLVRSRYAAATGTAAAALCVTLECLEEMYHCRLCLRRSRFTHGVVLTGTPLAFGKSRCHPLGQSLPGVSTGRELIVKATLHTLEWI